MIGRRYRKFSIGGFAMAAAALWGGPAAAQSGYSIFPVKAMDSSIVAPATTSHRVTLTVHDSTVLYVINELTRQAHLQPIYANTAALTKRISVRVSNMDAMDALAVALKGTGLQATLAHDGVTVMIRAQGTTSLDGHARADGGAVSGAVFDSASGQPITGAKVTVEGTNLTTVTSEKGEFAIEGVPDGAQAVVIRAFGYKPFRQMVSVVDGERRTLRAVMTATATILSGVVTTATGVQSKMSVGSDITTINVDSVMKTAPINTVTDLLENRVPGLTVVHTSGTPGDPSRLLLRGAASVNGSNNPIVVVDGVRVYDPANLGNINEQILFPLNSGNYDTHQDAPRPSPLDQIDPNTIASIEVLKGPSASALYGSDAANGVIVITTKKGQPGRTVWNITAQQGVSYIPGSYPNFTFVFGKTLSDGLGEVFCAGQLATSYTSGGYGSQCAVIDSVRTFNSLNDPRFSPLTSGPLSATSATVSGGAQALTYSFTGSWSNTHGMTKMPNAWQDLYSEIVGSAPLSWMAHPDDYVTGSVSGQMTALLSPSATLTVHDMIATSTQHRTNLGLNVVGQLIGTYIDTTNGFSTPFFDQNLTQIIQATLTSTTDANLNWQIRPWLPLNLTVGVNRNQENDKSYIPAGLPDALFLADGADDDTLGFYELGTGQVSVATVNANTIIPIPLGAGRTIRMAFGTNFVDQSIRQQDLQTTQIPVGVSDPTTFPQTTATTVRQASSSAATYGWFAEPQLQLGSRFFVTPGLRLDGGTASGSHAGVTAYPKTNLSYIVVDQNGGTGGASWIPALTLLRVRGALGIAGVQPLPAQNLRLLNAPSLGSLDGGQIFGNVQTLNSIGNTRLHPERSREFETGFDAQFFQDRLSLTATYYDKLRIDAIEQEPVAPSVLEKFLNPGVGSPSPLNTYANVGEIRNTGLELTVDATVFDRRMFQWTLNGTLSANQNKVLSTTGAYSSLCGNSSVLFTCVKAGYPLDAIFAKRIVGYGDANNDGILEPNEVQLSDSAIYLGVGDPRYTAAFGTTFALWHGQIAIATQGDYQSGLLIYSYTQELPFLESAASQPGASLYTEALIASNASAAGGTAEFWQKVNALRWDAVSATYTLPAVIARTLKGHQATLALQGSNLRLFTNYHGKDPNVNGNLATLTVNDTGQLPQPRTWRLTVRVTQ